MRFFTNAIFVIMSKYARSVVAHQKHFKHESKKCEDKYNPTVIVSTSLAFVKVHDAVTAAFEEIKNKLFPIYASRGAGKEN